MSLPEEEGMLAGWRALSVTGVVVEAEALARQGENERLAALYRVWLEANAGHPQAHFIRYNFGVFLTAIGDLAGARDALFEATRQQPDFFAAYINLGNLLERLVSPEAAAACWGQIVQRLAGVNPETLGFKNSALKQIGRVLTLGDAEDALRMSLELNPHQHDAMEHWISWRQQQCKWPLIEPFPGCDKRHLMQGFAPLALATYSDDPLLHLASARIYNRRLSGLPERHFLDRHRPGAAGDPARIRVGYLSSDLRVHAVGYLMVEVFECHDREKVEIFVYYTGPAADDPIQRRIRAAAEHWRDIAGVEDEEAARLMLDDRIEILLDINGYTQNARLKLLAMRPAPVIVNWLGFPGTMGSPYHHYLVADPFIIPPEHELFYSERVVRLPCYQPNDRQRRVSPHRPTRREAGLPETGMVYSCFNGIRKITGLIWRLWCRILRRVPGSVLWLLYENDASRDRLRILAAREGVEPERLIFAPLQPNEVHLARYPLADLVLDTFPYGAHTTASDALWMGVPILTLSGLGFASRVCGSLVRAAGMAEMVCWTEEAYEERAVELGLHPERLAACRERVAAQRDGNTLFDTPGLVAHLEGLCEQMREAFRTGWLPVPDLNGLERYQEIGIALDGDGPRVQTLAQLEAVYGERLAAIDRLEWLREDGRLWSAEARRRHAERERGFVREVIRLDGTGELQPFLQFVQDPRHDHRQLLGAIPELLTDRRVRAAYILAMLLANAGHRERMVAIALCVGGVLFDNPIEETRGWEQLERLRPEWPGGERRDVGATLVTPLTAWLAEEVAGRGGAGERIGRLEDFFNSP